MTHYRVNATPLQGYESGQSSSRVRNEYGKPLGCATARHQRSFMKGKLVAEDDIEK